MLDVGGPVRRVRRGSLVPAVAAVGRYRDGVQSRPLSLFAQVCCSVETHDYSSSTTAPTNCIYRRTALLPHRTDGIASPPRTSVRLHFSPEASGSRRGCSRQRCGQCEQRTGPEQQREQRERERWCSGRRCVIQKRKSNIENMHSGVSTLNRTRFMCWFFYRNTHQRYTSFGLALLQEGGEISQQGGAERKQLSVSARGN